MILRASGPAPSPFRPRELLLASPSRGEVEVDAPSAAFPLESGTWVPATGASFTLCFLGQPASSAAPAMSTAIDRMRFIYFSVRILRDPMGCKGTDDGSICVLVCMIKMAPTLALAALLRPRPAAAALCHRR